MSQLNVDTVRNRTGTNGGPTFDKGLTVSAGTTAYVYGNLQVDGTETIVNTETLDVADKKVGIASTTNASNTTADGAGIEVYGGSDGNKTLTWNNTGNTWTFAPTDVTVTVGSGVTIYGDTGIVSATSYRGDGGSLTGIAATDNINTNNIAISGIATVGTSITMRESAINVTGVITATSFVGDGSGLTNAGISAGKATALAAFLS
tara:strand:- start:29 stop:643 length:615 start_codon:yes stop_codon:yes gene_type:complete